MSLESDRADSVSRCFRTPRRVPLSGQARREGHLVAGRARISREHGNGRPARSRRCACRRRAGQGHAGGCGCASIDCGTRRRALPALALSLAPRKAAPPQAKVSSLSRAPGVLLLLRALRRARRARDRGTRAERGFDRRLSFLPEARSPPWPCRGVRPPSCPAVLGCESSAGPRRVFEAIARISAIQRPQSFEGPRHPAGAGFGSSTRRSPRLAARAQAEKLPKTRRQTSGPSMKPATGRL